VRAMVLRGSAEKTSATFASNGIAIGERGRVGHVANARAGQYVPGAARSGRIKQNLFVSSAARRSLRSWVMACDGVCAEGMCAYEWQRQVGVVPLSCG
jgi:hypothetical protein